LGVAFSGNLLTFLVCFELLTLFTFPLVIHEGTLEASKGARTYLIYTLGGGIVLLTGVVWLYGLAGPIDFSVKGVLQALPVTTHPQLIAIFVLLIVGVGVKAALFPLHGWLPEAMVAPAPVSALLHAVAVVKAGAFGVIRVVHHVYGEGFADSLGVLTPLAVLAGITIIVGSLRALTQNDLKRRLAYSTVSQVSYIVLGVSLAGMIAPVGGMVHLIHQGLMKITLFFCAGIFAQSLHIKSVSDMNGIGQKMPLTMLAFTVGALGMMGVPPVAGFVSKWYLGLGAASVGHYWAIALLMASAALNAGYFLPILYRAWFLEADDDGDLVLGASEWVLSKRTMLIPVLITALLSVLAGLFAMSDWSPLALVQAIVSQEYLP
jgi:multicomponent Na+:H+ antiporter subunit D